MPWLILSALACRSEAISDCVGTGLEQQALEWSLPRSLGATGVFTTQQTWGLDDRAWFLNDLDGDGTKDLVLTDAPDSQAMGNWIWRIYTNNHSGFEGEHQPWPLPRDFPLDAFITAEPSWDPDSDKAWMFQDLDGDGRIDLILANADGGAIGSQFWRIFANKGEGFEQSGKDWTLPNGYGSIFQDLPWDAYSNPGWKLIDMDGDGRLDLVLDGEETNEQGYPTHLRVHHNRGFRFANVAQKWPLPPDYERVYYVYTSELNEQWPSLGWHLIELNGEGGPELLRMYNRQRPDDSPLGTLIWHVYENQGNGFAEEPMVWDLPGGFPDGTFRENPDRGEPDDGYSWGDEDNPPPVMWTLKDMQGDGALDLMVVRDDADPALGTERWDVYTNTGDGFSAQPVPWILPPTDTEGAFVQPSGQELDDKIRWTLETLTADRAPDIVFTYGGRDADVGHSHWQVFAGACE